MLGALVSAGAKHHVGFLPLLAHRTAHYLRAYALARRRVAAVDTAIRQLGFLYHCFNCLHRGFVVRVNEVPDKCENCGKPNSYAGPLWTGPLFDSEFVQALTIEALVRQRKDLGELSQLASGMTAESRAPPLYFVVDTVCDKYGLPMPRGTLVAKVLNERGYLAVPSHFRPNAIRTNCPLSVFVKTVRELAPGS
jgi:tRNA (guanine26-N2/guanine27-N2)-dimethyltransferase